MSRTAGRTTTYSCLTCKAIEPGFWWSGNEYSKATEYNLREVEKLNASHSATTDCSAPHFSMPYGGRGSIGYGRNGTGKAVVYFYPDGDYAAPDSNDPNCDTAKSCAADGAMRVEFSSIYDLRNFQKERALIALEKWEREIDEGIYDAATMPDFKQMRDAIYETARNQVLEYDQRSLENGNDRIRETIKERQEKHRESMSRFKSMRIGRHGDNRRYERLRGNR